MKRFLKRDLQARGCNPLTPNCPAHSAGLTPLDNNLPPFWLQNRCSTFREGSLGPHWPLTKNKRGSLGPPWPKTLTFLPPWDASKSAQGENRNHQNTLGFIVLFCKGTYLGRSRGAPLAPKKTKPSFLEPPGTQRRDDTPPREPPGTSRARKPSFLKVCPTPLEASFEKHEYAPFSYQSNIFTLWIAKCHVQGPPWTL